MRRSLPCLLALLATIALGACGSDDDSQPASKTTKAQDTEQPSPSEQREALEDTNSRPHIPKPTGSPPRRLTKEDIVKGKGAPAKAGDVLTVQYVGVTFSTGEEFDASWDRGQPFQFPLGAGQVIKGWDQGLIGMRVGGLRRLTIPPSLGYGNQAVGPIPPNSTLVFDVRLISVG
jgi:peptidylprolyl isomerase